MRLILAIFLLTSPEALCQSDGEIYLGIYLDSAIVEGRINEAKEIVREAASSAELVTGSIVPIFLTSMEETLAENLTAILTAALCKATQQQAEELAVQGKLHIAITESGCPRIEAPTALTLPLASMDADLIQLFTDLRTKDTLTWDDVTIIHDDSIDKKIISDLIKTLIKVTKARRETFITVIDISSQEAMSMRLGTLFSQLGRRPGEPKNRQFLAILAGENVNPVQDLAREMQLVNYDNQWLFVVPDSHSMNHDMERYINGMVDGEHIAFAKNISDLNPTMNCEDNFQCYLKKYVALYASELSNALVKELDLYYQVSEEEWEEIKPTPAQRAATVVSLMKGKQENGTVCSLCTRWSIQAVEILGMRRFELLEVADWRPSTGLVLKDDIFPHITGGFRKRVITVTSVHFPPWQILNKDTSGRITEYKGLMFEILNELGSRLNFTYVVRIPQDNKWGVVDSYGNWNGMIRMIKDKEVLLGCAAFTVSAERMSAVNFTATIDRQPYAFLISRPREMARTMLFMEPFNNDTWLLIIISIIVMGPVLYFVNRYSPFYTYYNLYDGLGLFDFQNCYWYIYSSVVQQGGTKVPTSDSGRLIVGFWWLYIIVIVTSYSGNLVAYLTFPKVENPIQTLDDLLQDKDNYRWGYVGGEILEDYFQTAEGKFYEIGQLAEVLTSAEQETYDRIKVSDYAFLAWKTKLLFTMKEQFLMTDECDFSLGVEEFYHENVALAVPRGSPYIEIVNKEIELMQRGGLVEKWKQDYWPRKDKCSSTAYGGTDSTRSVSLGDMQGSFILLLFGLLIAFLFMVSEFIMSLYKRNKKPGSSSSGANFLKSFMA